ncbi:MAG: response regulator, partial [Ignavibacteriaceae bacterium]
MKILLAEDEKITRKSLTDILTAEKHEVVSFDNGNQAYESIKKNDYDVIITDIRLPGMNGIDILKNAKELNPKIIVIIITAYASVETAVEALKFGAYDYLIKPFSPVQLLSILQHIDQLKLV